MTRGGLLGMMLDSQTASFSGVQALCSHTRGRGWDAKSPIREVYSHYDDCPRRILLSHSRPVLPFQSAESSSRTHATRPRILPSRILRSLNLAAPIRQSPVTPVLPYFWVGAPVIHLWAPTDNGYDAATTTGGWLDKQGWRV